MGGVCKGQELIHGSPKVPSLEQLPSFESGKRRIVVLSTDPALRAQQIVQLQNDPNVKAWLTTVGKGEKDALRTPGGDAECRQNPDAYYCQDGMTSIVDHSDHSGVTVFSRIDLTSTGTCGAFLRSNGHSGNVGCGSIDDMEFTPVGQSLRGAGVLDSVLGGLVDLLPDIIRWKYQLIPICASVPSDALNKTPDRDEQDSWYSAERAIMDANAGNLGSLKVDYRSDVRYPGGQIAQVRITDIYRSSSGNVLGTSVTRSSVLPEPNGPCTP